MNPELIKQAKYLKDTQADLDKAKVTLRTFDQQVRSTAPPAHNQWMRTIYGHLRKVELALKQVLKVQLQGRRARVRVQVDDVREFILQLRSYAAHLLKTIEAYQAMATVSDKNVLLSLPQFQKSVVRGAWNPQHLLTGSWQVPPRPEAFNQPLSRLGRRWVKNASQKNLHKIDLVTARLHVYREDSNSPEVIGPFTVENRRLRSQHAEQRCISALRTKTQLTAANVTGLVFVVTLEPCVDYPDSCTLALKKLAKEYQANVIAHVPGMGSRTYR